MLASISKITQKVASAESLQTALDLVVDNVKRAMHTDVCSIYLYFPDSCNFVLMASQGLQQSAIGKLHIPEGQGLIGYVAKSSKPVRTNNASAHKYYYHVKDIGEESFNAFLGVPIVHHRKVLGVLVVQHSDSRQYSDDEESMLVTLSAQLASYIAHAEATGGGLRADTLADEASTDVCYMGVSGSGGVAIAKVAVITPSADLKKVPDKQCEDIAAEIEAFENALQAVRRKIKVVSRTLARSLKNQEQELFEVYMRMLDDDALAGEIITQIRGGQWAQGALRYVVGQHVKAFEMMDDPYLRERATDIKDLGRRVLAELQQTQPKGQEFTDDTVLVAEEMTATMLAEVPTDKLKAIISIQGSDNSHAAILARSMGIPTVMGAVDFPYTKMQGKEVIVNGYLGQIYVNASPGVYQAYQQIIVDEANFSKELEVFKELPAQTKDGYQIPLFVNTSMPVDIARGLEQGAEGVGLYRTEVPFMLKQHFPSEQEQVNCYRDQLKGFAPLPVTMRTLDIGGDKALPYFTFKEDNPFLGWRGIRFTLDHKEIFLVQLRAMLKANQGLENLKILLPMITHVNEVDDARALINQAYEELLIEGYEVCQPDVGVMIEVPAVVYQIHHIIAKVDFISVGSNDLTQYLLAVDRDNPNVAELYHALHPAVLTAINHVAQAGKQSGKPVSICGELASDPAGALLLLAMGYDSLSLNVSSLLKVKSAIRSFSLTSAQQMLAEALQQSTTTAVEAVVSRYMQEAGLKRMYSNVVKLRS